MERGGRERERGEGEGEEREREGRERGEEGGERERDRGERQTDRQRGRQTDRYWSHLDMYVVNIECQKWQERVKNGQCQVPVVCRYVKT